MRNIVPGPRFLALWTGMSLSVLGDGISFVAMVWLAFDRSHSARAVAELMAFYTAPVIVGGWVSGWLLDRFDRGTVLAADGLLRALVFFGLGFAATQPWFALWMIELAAACYGFLKMIPLAGVPAAIPQLVGEDQLGRANALESGSYTIGGIVAPLLAGWLIATRHVPLAFMLDGLSYALFAGLVVLAAIPRHARRARGASGFRFAFRDTLRIPVVRTTTIMFMCFNVGDAMVNVVLPGIAAAAGHGATTYGSALAVAAVGQVGGTTLAGAWVASPAGPWIALFQAVGGASLLLLLSPQRGGLFVAMALVGLASAPLTIWAQNVRMRVIPAELHGRAFATLRTMMQATPPAGALLAGAVAPFGGTVTVVLIGAAIAVLPALFALARPASLADAPEDSTPAGPAPAGAA